ncbi:MAG: hypothetical protein KDA59_20140, partial [Planctomycetales bacterium]|nr:hypothetical protein [Planctomycetales bacterium]
QARSDRQKADYYIQIRELNEYITDNGSLTKDLNSAKKFVQEKVTASVTLTPNAYTLEVLDTNKTVLQSVGIVVPNTALLAQPQSIKVWNNRYASTESDRTATEVFGDYLRVQGNLGDIGNDVSKIGTLGFFLFTSTDARPYYFASALEPNISKIESDGNWKSELRLPRLSRGVKGQIWAYSWSNKGLNRVFATEAISFTIVEDSPTIVAPTITTILKATPDGKENGNLTPDGPSPKTWIANAAALKDGNSKVVIKGQAKAVAEQQRSHSRVLLYKSTGSVPERILGDGTKTGFEIDGNGNWSAIVEVGDDGDYDFTAVVVQGNHESEPSDAAKVMVRKRGPKIADIEPRNMLFGSGRIVSTVYFSPDRPLNKATAQDTTNYAIIHPAIGTPDSKHPFSADFDALTNSVKLT